MTIRGFKLSSKQSIIIFPLRIEANGDWVNIWGLIGFLLVDLSSLESEITISVNPSVREFSLSGEEVTETISVSFDSREREECEFNLEESILGCFSIYVYTGSSFLLFSILIKVSNK